MKTTRNAVGSSGSNLNLQPKTQQQCNSQITSARIWLSECKRTRVEVRKGRNASLGFYQSQITPTSLSASHRLSVSFHHLALRNEGVAERNDNNLANDP